MEAVPGGGSRFGALSIVLGDMGYFWQMYTPPYIILLIRVGLGLGLGFGFGLGLPR